MLLDGITDCMRTSHTPLYVPYALVWQYQRRSKRIAEAAILRGS